MCRTGTRTRTRTRTRAWARTPHSACENVGPGETTVLSWRSSQTSVWRLRPSSPAPAASLQSSWPTPEWGRGQTGSTPLQRLPDWAGSSQARQWRLFSPEVQPGRSRRGHFHCGQSGVWPGLQHYPDIRGHSSSEVRREARQARQARTDPAHSLLSDNAWCSSRETSGDPVGGLSVRRTWRPTV